MTVSRLGGGDQTCGAVVRRALLTFVVALLLASALAATARATDSTPLSDATPVTEQIATPGNHGRGLAHPAPAALDHRPDLAPTPVEPTPPPVDPTPAYPAPAAVDQLAPTPVEPTPRPVDPTPVPAVVDPTAASPVTQALAAPTEPAGDPGRAPAAADAPTAAEPAGLASLTASTPAPLAPPVLPGTSRVSVSSAPPSVRHDTSDATEAGGPAGAPPSFIAAVLASGAPAALLPFLSPSAMGTPRLLLSPATRRALDRNATSGANAAATPSPADPGGGGNGPAPSGPPGSASSGAGSAAPGGLSSAVWCEIVIVLLALSGRELRRHRLRPVLSPAAGFTSLLQRPG
jgi:hypothetical protein